MTEIVDQNYSFDRGDTPRRARMCPMLRKVPRSETFLRSCIKTHAHVARFDGFLRRAAEKPIDYALRADLARQRGILA